MHQYFDERIGPWLSFSIDASQIDTTRSTTLQELYQHIVEECQQINYH